MMKAIFRRAAVSTALAAGAMGLFFSPASAATGLDTDSVLINGTQVDFGNYSHVNGSPTGPGSVTWSDTGSGIEARLTGRVYWDSSRSGCGRVKMTMYNTAGAVVAGPTYSARPCRSGGGTGYIYKNVDNPLTHPDAFKVVITTQTAPSETSPSSAYQDLQSVTRYFHGSD